MQDVSRMFMEIKNENPRLAEYRILFADSLRVQKAIYDFYAVVVCFCKHVLLSDRKQGCI